MKKIIATIIKEWLLLRRDVSGLLLLLIMPAVLIVIMALVQDAPFKDYQDVRFDLLMADNDQGKMSAEIKNGLRQSKNFKVIDELNGQPVTDSMLKSLLQKGTYKVGIIIPKGATAEVNNAANKVANSLAARLGVGTLPTRALRDSVHVQLYFDPLVKPTFRTSIYFALDKFITFSSTSLLVQRISHLGGGPVTDSSATDGADEFKKIFAGIGIQEQVLSDAQGPQISRMNSVQHNVPAWAIFGMFFIVVPLSGHMIREREEGSSLRLRLIPHAQAGVAMGKIFFNAIICMLQFLAMCCIGVWVLPLLGLSSLNLGIHPMALIPVVFSTALVATSYGYFIGIFFKTTNQAMPFGAISIVILAALGGILVPKEILPPTMQTIALGSPLYWGLDGVNEIMFRDGNLLSVLKHVVVLNTLAVLLGGISMLYEHFNSRSI
jgi:ABC-2 type transport system permease protein